MPRGKHNQACCDLSDHLATVGITATVGHSKRSSRSPTVLTVLCHSAEDVDKIPLGFHGYRVYTTTLAEHEREMREQRDCQTDDERNST